MKEIEDYATTLRKIEKFRVKTMDPKNAIKSYLKTRV